LQKRLKMLQKRDGVSSGNLQKLQGWYPLILEIFAPMLRVGITSSCNPVYMQHHGEIQSVIPVSKASKRLHARSAINP